MQPWFGQSGSSSEGFQLSHISVATRAIRWPSRSLLEGMYLVTSGILNRQGALARVGSTSRLR